VGKREKENGVRERLLLHCAKLKVEEDEAHDTLDIINKTASECVV
jgi:hypothetical protein